MSSRSSRRCDQSTPAVVEYPQGGVRQRVGEGSRDRLRVCIVALLRDHERRGTDGCQLLEVLDRRPGRQLAQRPRHRGPGKTPRLPARPDPNLWPGSRIRRLFQTEQLRDRLDITGIDEPGHVVHPANRWVRARLVHCAREYEHQPVEAVRRLGDEPGQRSGTQRDAQGSRCSDVISHRT